MKRGGVLIQVSFIQISKSDKNNEQLDSENFPKVKFIEELKLRLGGWTRTRCLAILPCTGPDLGTKVFIIFVFVVIIVIVIANHDTQATTHAVFRESCQLSATTQSEFTSLTMSFQSPCTVGRITTYADDKGNVKKREEKS